MTDTATTDTTEPTTEPQDVDTTDWKADAEKWQALARKHEDRAKANASAAKELEQVRQASMTDLEKAVTEARLEGETAATRKAAAKVAAASIRAAAAGRLQVTPEILEGINLTAFVDDDGEVDEARVAKFVDSIAPAVPDPQPGPTVLDLGQGARPVVALNSSQLERDLRAKLGI